MEAARATGGEFSATWRDQDGAIVGQTFGGTMCWFPRKPWSLRISHEDYSAIVPCGECPGCLEFYRRRLADRLKAKYGSAARKLYLVRIYVPIDRHAEWSRKLHRRLGLELEPGFIRLGATSFAVIARSQHRTSAVLKSAGIKHRVGAIRLSRGRRAWREATAGMLVSREAYGEQVNRWYIPGLPPAERERWEVSTKAGVKGYSRSRDPRVWKRGNLTLVPPEVWQIGRNDRRTVRRELGRVSSPEGVARVMAMVSELVARKSQSSSQSAAVRPLLSRAQVIESYQRMAMRKSDASVSERPSLSSSPPSKGGGYISSVHLGGNDPPGSRADDGLYHGVEPFVPRHMPALPEDSLTDLTAKQFQKRRDRRLLDEHLEKLRVRIQGRS